jgi:hypothetical protein
MEGLASGDPIPVDENFWSDLRKEAEQRVEARKAGTGRNTDEAVGSPIRENRRS